jgi:hypothetical protein
MAWQVSKRVWDSIKTKEGQKEKIDASERLMLLALADKADEQGICWPKHDTSYQTLGDMVGVNRRSAIRLIDNLSEMGHIWKSETVGRGHSNIFIIIIGLSEAEIKGRLALIGVTDDTNNKEEKALPETPIKGSEKEMVLPVTQNGVMDDTNKGVNGVTGNTQSFLKSPSIPTDSPKGALPKPDQKLKAREPTEKQLQAQAMFVALVNACRYDLSLISEKERGALNQAEARMRQNKFTPADVEGFSEWWYANDWRGQKDQAPTLKDIKENWGRYKAFLNGEKGGSNPQNKPELNRNGVYKNGRKTTVSNHRTGPVNPPVSATGLGEWTEDEKRLYGFS